MTGIAAVFDKTGHGPCRDSLERVINSLKLYGPDRSGLRISGPFGLCWTHGGGYFPQDQFERQPLIVARWSCVFSGHLVYRDELADTLGITPDRLASMPDSALFLAAWQKWQQDTGEHVEGEYAAIIGDNESNALFALRSPTGAPPLYYHDTPDRFLIACIPKALFAHGDVPRQLDEAKLADSMVLNYEYNPGCYYQGLTSIRSGTMVRVTATDIRVHGFFDVRTAPEIRFASDEDYVEAARELVRNAVGQYMAGPDIPAAHLSAGLDSSTVVVTMLDLLAESGRGEERIDTYTHVPEPGWDGRAYGHLRFGDESPMVRELAARYPQINPHFIDCADAPLGGGDTALDKLFLLAEQPPRGISNLHWGDAINRRIRASGKRIALGGASGNATISFNARGLYGQWFRQGRWLKLWRELAADKTPGFRFCGVYSRAIAPSLPPSVTRTIARLRGLAAQSGWGGYSAISPDYAAEMDVDGRAEAVGWDTSYSGFTDAREMMYTMLQRGGRDEGAAFRQAQMVTSGVLTVDPLGDPRLLRFCAGIPMDQYLRNGNHRFLVTRMMAGRLPDIYFSPRRGRQTADWHYKMTRDLDHFRQQVAEMKADPDIARRFDIARLERVLETWPDKTPLSHRDHPDYAIAMLGLGRATTTARFINWVEGKNR
ncbi:MAG: asparagine synthase-related protein [Pseudomonadota bacterium]